MRNTMRNGLTAALKARNPKPIGALRSALVAIVETEVRERSTNASEYERLGQYERAQRLRAEADVLDGYLAESP